MMLTSIPRLRPLTKSKCNIYNTCEVPDIHDMIELDGYFEWSNLDYTDILKGRTAWDTFKQSPKLHSLFVYPLLGTVNCLKQPDKRNRVTFYQDSLRMLSWSVELHTGIIFENSTGVCVARDIEEFWLRLFIESKLYFLFANDDQFFIDDLNPLSIEYKYAYRILQLRNISHVLLHI